MAVIKLSSKQKLIVTICISFAFFVAEVAIAFYTGSLALLADAFHIMNDLIGFSVALVALIISEHTNSPQDFSFGWARAQLLGAFFNGVFLLALGISIFLQSIERLIFIEHIGAPKLVLIMGCVGLTLNIISATILHEHHGHDHDSVHIHAHHHGPGFSRQKLFHHSHSNDDANIESAMPCSDSSSRMESSVIPIDAHTEHRHTLTKLQAPGRDLGMMGVLIHVIGDALNNVGVIIAALVIWLTDYDARFYADPGASVGISVIILLSSLPLVKNSGNILMQSAPKGVDLGDVKHDLEKIPGIESVHELHIWQLDQRKTIASAHIVVSNNEVADFMERARTISECLHAYDIHSATLQPELATTDPKSPVILSETASSSAASSSSTVPAGRRPVEVCRIACSGALCEGLTCCNSSLRI
ncbi:hypothetical protein DL766_003106 [Monosporascus sp. MC13-8B]|uniref:Cation efflux protein cytoplasmic domain-containing protein n=1 Tax=Monosporascus cannonballus TaxID=155416 RepID=A0ABY0HCT8_9PEZI|nr:hypothetical protein DL763_006689 [Monosporascus cannonballus]RYO88616.1 hypothetical protein DL762_003652 [Monosporascus cannonballus]RYP34205.1 hypothetical protein DL766_003106 [Monosporascus sp. MC13-8B]